MHWLHFLSRKNSGNGHDSGPPVAAPSWGNLVHSGQTHVALNAAVSALVDKSAADGAAVALAEKGQLVCRASAGEIAPDVGVALTANTGITGACVRSAKLLHCRDTQLDSRVDAAVCRTSGIRSILVTPILLDGAVVGIVEALSSRPNAFQPAHENWLRAVADWLREICYCSNQNPGRPSIRQTPVEPKSAHKLPTSGAAQPAIAPKRPPRDPGLASFRETLEQIPVASTWEDICHLLVRRFVA